MKPSQLKSNQIKAVIFDLDDLMVNSSPHHFSAFKRAFAEYGIDLDKLDKKTMAKVFGLTISEETDVIAKHFNIKINKEDFLKKRNFYFLESVKKGIEPMPGLYTLINNMKTWDFRCALASSGYRYYIDLVLEQLGLKEFFEAIISCEDIKKGKPEPEIFLLTAKKLNLPPEECVVIEDSENGVIAAKRAGMKAVGVHNSMIDLRQDLSRADVILDRLDEITLDKISCL